MGWDATNSLMKRVQLSTGSSGAIKVALGSTQSADALAVTQALNLTAAGGSAPVAVGTWDFNGASLDKHRTAAVIKPIAPTAVTAGTGITIWTPGAGKKFRLMGWILSVTVAGEIILGDNAIATIIARTGLLPAAIAQQSPSSLGNSVLSAAANNVLKLDVTVNATVQGIVFGTEE
jgi:hypothetical protein